MGTISKIIKRIKVVKAGDSFVYEGATFTYNGKYWAMTDLGYLTQYPSRNK